MALFNDISDYALSLPGAYMTEQWMGAHVFKISDNKMFCVLRPETPNMLIKLGSVESRDLLIESGVAVIHSHMKRGSWADILTDKMDKDDIIDRLEQSYQLVRFGLSKARQAELPPSRNSLKITANQAKETLTHSVSIVKAPLTS